MQPAFDGLTCNLSSLALLSDAQSRSISAENRTGAKSGGGRELPPLDEQGRPTGVARELGQGWKVHPSDPIPSGETLTLADIEGPGCIQHIWMTPTGDYRTANLLNRYPAIPSGRSRRQEGCRRTACCMSSPRLSEISVI